MERARSALAVAVLVVLWWAVRVLSPGRVLTVSQDLRSYYLPAYEAFYGDVAAGRVSAWNPYQLCGLPWSGALETGFAYPPHALYVIFPVRIALALSGLFHLAVAAVTTAALVRALGFGVAASVLAVTMFVLRGVFPGLLHWPHLLEAAAWMPLGALGVLDVARGSGRRGMSLVALAMGLSVLAACPQMTLFLAYVWVTLLAAFLVGRGGDPRTWLRASGWLAAGLALGALVGAAALVPALEMAHVGTRGPGPLTVDQMYPTGQPGLSLLWQLVTGSHRSYGALALSLAPAALLARRHRRAALWALALGVLAFVFALGPSTPLFGLYLHLPGLSAFREPQRILFVVDFCVALLAGAGLDAIVAEPASRRRRLVVGPSLACAVILTAYLAGRGTRLDVFVATGTAIALGAGLAEKTGRLAAPGCLALAAAQVFVPALAADRLPYDAGAADGALLAYQETYAALAERQGSARVWVVLPDSTPKLAGVHRVRAIDDYEGLTLRRQAEYFTYAIEGSTISSNVNRIYRGFLAFGSLSAGRSPLATRRRLLDLAALRLIAVPDTLLARPEVRVFVEQAGLAPRPSPETGMALFENPHALPRAFVTYRTRPAPPPDDLLRRLSEPEFDPLVESYVEGGLEATGPAAPSRGSPAVLVRDDEGVVEVDATLAVSGLVVLADSFAPGWQATVDGRPASILATNHLFRGVPAPAGRHVVRFAYRAWSLFAGTTLSLAGAALLAGLLVTSRRGRRAAAP